MKRFLIAAAVAATTLTAPAFAADVGVSISIGEPGFYGRLDIGDFPQPQVIYRQPIIVERGPASRPPVYTGTAGSSQALEQVLPPVQRVRGAGLFRAGQVV